jgi:hypothetical protein
MNSIEIVAGVAALLTAFAMIWRHVLLSPSSSAWPKAPRWLRTILFAGLAVVFYAGMNLLLAGLDQAHIPPTDRSELLALVFGSSAIVETAFAVNLAIQRLPPSLWTRLDRLATIVRCKPRQAGQILQPAELAAVASTINGGNVWAPSADAMNPVRPPV